MKVIDPGHHYELDWLDGEPQMRYTDYESFKENELIFVKREGDKYPGNVGSYPGTTMQEVLRALIERSSYVNNQNPCWETEQARFAMEKALVLFEMRAARCHNRLDEFFFIPIRDVISGVNKCKHCGHVGCNGEH